MFVPCITPGCCRFCMAWLPFKPVGHTCEVVDVDELRGMFDVCRPEDVRGFHVRLEGTVYDYGSAAAFLEAPHEP